MNTVIRTPISEQLLTQFNLPPETIQVCDKYYILYWQASYVYTQLLECPRIMREKIPYQPIFMEGLSRDCLCRHPDIQVRLSFRRLRGKIAGYVLIAPLKSSPNTGESA